MEDAQGKGGLSRREVLNGALRGVAGAGMALLPGLMPTGAEGATAATATPVPNWVPVGPTAQFTPSVPVRVALHDGSVLWVTKAGPKLTDALEAVSARCTHHGCEVGWAAADRQLECPCHGGAFLPDGSNVHGTRRHPDEKLPALTAYPVRILAGQVQVNMAAAPAGSAVPGRQD